MPLARTPLRTAGAAGRSEWAWGKSWLAGAAWHQATSGAPAANARQATAASGGRRRRLVMEIPGHGRLASAGDVQPRHVVAVFVQLLFLQNRQDLHVVVVSAKEHHTHQDNNKTDQADVV